MELIDSGFDNILNKNYELYSVKLGELKDLVISWYGVDTFEDFDLRVNHNPDENIMQLLKKAGCVCNYFYALKEDNKFYLLDGFNRLLTEYGVIEKDTKVYLKIITDKLKDNELMSLMFTLNLWKLSKTRNNREFDTEQFFDRGMRLLLFKKYGLSIYNYSNGNRESYESRKRNKNDFDELDCYFIHEMSYAGYFKYELTKAFQLFNSPTIISDLKEIIDSNNYLSPPFYHYDKFLNGFIMFLSRRRLNGDFAEYKFQSFVQKLSENKRFFNKLVNMSWTDSTRKNIYNYFKNIEQFIDETGGQHR